MILNEPDAVASLTDLCRAFDAYTAKPSKKPKSSKDNAPDPTQARSLLECQPNITAHIMQVLMDLILGCMSIPHSMNRKIAAFCFRGFAAIFTPAAIATLNEV